MVATSSELTQEKIQQAIDVLLRGIPPKTELHSTAIAAFKSGDYKQVKKLSLLHVSDKYLQALSYLGGALNPTNIASGNSYTILSESVRNFLLFDQEAWKAIETEFNAVIE
ncbi:hypothetical protein [Anabaena azotica]|uniref:Uncharacterized protein n=1 Tax=Anabaena azotica FACHB-119 TaxID=947527 RepID=A0ABR8DFA6_9NOST|nr:hypothetical protein [Anabaena azotica]MBD2505324.1 hypothetical protein [Anabaena azotica FACHB-119]